MKNVLETIAVVIVLWVVVGVITVAFMSLGCGGVAFDACHTPEAVRCDGSEAQRCEGGHWYPDHDCAETGQVCRVKQGVDREVVRCE